MDPRLLRYYERELQFLREMGGEFAAEFPKVAGRLGMDGFEVSDPFVERLLEGVAFLTARVQLKQDAEFPKFTQHMLEMVYPHYLAPTPSMAVVRFQPDLTEGSLDKGFVLPRQTILRSVLGKGDQTACEFRTAHPVTLWPMELEKAEYFTRDEAMLDLPDLKGVKAGLRLRLRTTAGLTFDQLALDSLPIYLHGQDHRRHRLYEQLLANSIAVIVRPPQRGSGVQKVLDASHIRRLGFENEQSLLPQSNRSFQGYRVLDEYFAFPDRYMFVEVNGLSEAVKKCTGTQLDILVLFNRQERGLENVVAAQDFSLYCTPAANLFPKRVDRIHLSDEHEEFHVVPDRTRPLDYEVYSLTRAVGYGQGGENEQEFFPFYSFNDLSRSGDHQAYYATHRVPRVTSSRQQRVGTRSSYVGNELFVSLVDGREGPFRNGFRQLAIEALCTNRDLPLHMPVGRANTDFTLVASAPVQSVRILSGPTRPTPSPTFSSGELSWRLINHLSLNYLSLVDTDEKVGAAALRELLSLYANSSEPATMKQIEGVQTVSSRPVVRRIPTPGPIAYGRGVEVTLTFDETAFDGSGAFLLGSVLEEFFARYVSLNSFTETALKTLDRGEIARWPLRIGRRHRI
ncbi:type VI secretion system baseplate subunit TssF [Schlesneria paludicola]|uniref:type VI secretion system baseplate subunit TssF n=1 Tax=Schlesneria paludicola TaxID=360056 RepID=UPI00029B13D9|nr:type VI secretion system baseplate subunit TssF [Schlesneria paludicola]